MTPQHDERPWRFGLRGLLLATAAVAFTAAAAGGLPSRSGSICLLVATLILPGVLTTLAANGGATARTFCLPALLPLAFGLYAIGWSLGWTVYSATTPAELLAYFDARGAALKAVILAAWACGGTAGIVCLIVRRLAQRPR